MTDEQPEAPDRLDIVEAAAELGLHPQSMRRLIKNGTVLATKSRGKFTIDRHWFNQFKQNYNPKPGRRPKPTLF